MYQDRKLKPRRPDSPFRIALVLLSRLFDWRDALIVIQPQTLVRWHRQSFHLFWRWKSHPGRPLIPVELRRVIGTLRRECDIHEPYCRLQESLGRTQAEMEDGLDDQREFNY